MTQDFSFDTLTEFARHAAKDPNSPAFVFPERRLTKRELYERIVRWTGFLQSQGVQPGQRIGLTIPDEALHLELTWAICACAAASLNMPSHRSTEQRCFMADVAGLSLHIVADEALALPGQNTLVVQADDCPAQLEGITGTPYTDKTAEMLLFSTSGTTGPAKIFARTIGYMGPGILGTAESFAEMLEEEGRECNLLRAGTVEHDNHRVTRFSQGFAGGVNSFMTPFRPEAVTEFCEDAGVSIINLGAFWLNAWAEHPLAKKLNEKILITVGGAAVSAKTRKLFCDRVTDRLKVIYATSEIGILAVADTEHHQRSDNCLGKPIGNAEISLRSPDGKEVPNGSQGVAWVRTGTPMKTYITGQAGANTDGWFCTGDVLSFLEDGCLSFHGRADDMMSLNGINIFPSAIEDCFKDHPAVRHVTAYGVPSKMYGDIPEAAVVLNPAANAPSERELLTFCRKRLGSQSPRKVVFLDKIPCTEQGKPLRRALVAAALAERAVG